MMLWLRRTTVGYLTRLALPAILAATESKLLLAAPGVPKQSPIHLQSSVGMVTCVSIISCPPATSCPS